MTFSEYCNKKSELIKNRIGTPKRVTIPDVCNALSIQYLQEIYPYSCIARVSGGVIELEFNWNEPCKGNQTPSDPIVEPGS